MITDRRRFLPSLMSLYATTSTLTGGEVASIDANFLYKELATRINISPHIPNTFDYTLHSLQQLCDSERFPYNIIHPSL